MWRVAAAILSAVVAVQLVWLYDLSRRAGELEGRLDRLARMKAAVPGAWPLTVNTFHDTAGRERVHCAKAGRTAVLLAAGQSLAANTAQGPIAASRDVLNYNLYDQSCYRAKDPLLGTSGGGANMLTRLGDLLIESGQYDRVILVPVAVSSTRIEQWAPGSVHHVRILSALAHLAEFGIPPTAILWQQGESNSDDSEPPEIGEIYFQSLRAIVRSAQDNWARAPFYVALGTRCQRPPNETIRAAQGRVAEMGTWARQGPDTDRLGPEYRFDDCHFNERGKEAQAKLWAAAILQHPAAGAR